MARRDEREYREFWFERYIAWYSKCLKPVSKSSSQ